MQGPEYKKELDEERLKRAIDKVRKYWLEGWGTLRECEVATGVPQASASSLFRQLGYEENGGYLREKRRIGDPSRGVYEYRLLENEKANK